MSSLSIGLTRVCSEDLTRLVKGLHRGLFPSPLTRSSLIAGGFGDVEQGLEPLVGRDVASAIAIVAAVLAERSVVHTCSATLLHQGPSVPGTRSRDVLEQVRELISSAQASVDLIGLSLEDDRLCRTLHALVHTRGIDLRLVLDLGDPPDPARARAFLSEHRLVHDKVQALYAPRGRMRSRLVLVDDRAALVVTGALTSTEEDGTFDAGVIVRDPALVAAAREEYRRLSLSNELIRLEAQP